MKIEPGDIIATGTSVSFPNLRLAFADKGDRYDYVSIGYHNPKRDSYEFWNQLESYVIFTADKIGLPLLEKIKLKIPPDIKRKIVQGVFIK